MAIAQRHLAQQYAGRGGPSGLADVLEVLLDKGLVIDAYVRVSLVGIELLTVDARVVLASVDTYLRFAEAVNRLDLAQAGNAQTLGDLVGGGSTTSRRGRPPTGDGNGADRGNGGERLDRSRSLGRGEPADADEGASTGDDEPAETTSSGREPAAEGTEAPDAGDEHDDGPGLLSRIKKRGQVFDSH
jgi:hypothetical protein